MNASPFAKSRLWRRLAALLAAVPCAVAAWTGGSSSVGQARALPLFFVPHRVEAGAAGGYLLRAPHMAALFTPSGASFEARGERFELRFLGANPMPRIEPADRLAGKVNYLTGSRPEHWQANVSTYGAIVYRGLYEGIDLHYAAGRDGLKSEFHLRPGADPGVIRWRYHGAGVPRLSGDGDLIVPLAGGEFAEHRPVLYQEAGGRRVPVEGAYQVLEDGSAGFLVGPYDRTRALVIDPVLSYSTFLGGGGLDWARAVAADGAGNVYVAGFTDSSDFPVASPYQATRRGGVDAFVAKLNPAGTALVYCTYLGGSLDDRAFGVAVDSAGSAYVTGWTSSSNFPTTSGARQRAPGGGRDAFVAKLNPAGSALEYSTYLGGSGNDSANAIAVDGAGNAHVAGDTASTNFPVLNAWRSSAGGGQDAFAARLNAAGSGLIWSTYLGGGATDSAAALALDAAGNVLVTGGTTSTDFPTHLAVQGASGGAQDAFVVKLSSAGGAPLFSTYLGGSGGAVGSGEAGAAIAADAQGNVYVAGHTSSTNFPTVNAYRSTHSGGTIDCFLSKLNAAGSALVYSTYYGGSGADWATAIGVSSNGAAVVAGYTSSSNLPLVSPVQPARAGGFDGFVARLAPAGNALEMATYLGGADADTVSALAVDAGGTVWIAGQTLSPDFPVRQPLQSSIVGGYSAFLAKLSEAVPTAVFRSGIGNTILTTYGSPGLANALGTIASAPSLSQNPAGDTFVVGRTSSGRVWMNRFVVGTQAWAGWEMASGFMTGDPAIAADPGGGAYVVARDASLSYWITRWTPGAGFGAWTALGGNFATDPAIACGADGAVHIVGRDSTGVVAGGRFGPGGGFAGWVPASSGPPAAGKPAITIGSDGAAYVAARAAATNNTWMARLQGGVWGTWHNGGGTAKTDPEVAATAGWVYAAVTNIHDQVYVQAFREGTGNGWQGWQFLNGVLVKAGMAASGGRYYVAGRNSAGTLYWYQSGVGWTFLGHSGLAASDLAASPR